MLEFPYRALVNLLRQLLKKLKCQGIAIMDYLKDEEDDQQEKRTGSSEHRHPSKE